MTGHTITRRHDRKVLETGLSWMTSMQRLDTLPKGFDYLIHPDGVDPFEYAPERDSNRCPVQAAWAHL